MFNISNDNILIEEIIKKNWPGQANESAVKDESDWDILTDNNANDASSRHWFKQNYINQMPQHTSMVTYH